MSDNEKTIESMTESELRETNVPWPKSEDELLSYIRALVTRKHDYGTCVYAMSMAAVATFYYVSHMLGVTGFQASCADLDIIRRTRMYKAGFRILDYSKLLYPQYLDSESFPTHYELLMENREQLAKLAQDELEKSGERMHPDVRQRMKYVASLKSH